MPPYISTIEMPRAWSATRKGQQQRYSIVEVLLKYIYLRNPFNKILIPQPFNTIRVVSWLTR